MRSSGEEQAAGGATAAAVPGPTGDHDRLILTGLRPAGGEPGGEGDRSRLTPTMESMEKPSLALELAKSSVWWWVEEVMVGAGWCGDG